jgi:hypothetical protein
MNIHEAIKACLETGKVFKNEYFSIIEDNGNLHLQNLFFNKECQNLLSNKECLIRRYAQEGFEEISTFYSWKDLCLLAKDEEVFADRKKANGSILVLHFPKKGIVLLNGETYFPTKEDTCANDWERLSNPKYKINDRVIFQRFSQEIIEIRWHRTNKEWRYLLLHHWTDRKEITEVAENSLKKAIEVLVRSEPKYQVNDRVLYINEEWFILENFWSEGHKEWRYSLQHVTNVTTKISITEGEGWGVSEKMLKKVNDSERPKPKYKVGDRVVCKRVEGDSYTITKIKWCLKHKEWAYTLYHPAMGIFNKDDDVSERYLKLIHELIPEPKYKVGFRVEYLDHLWLIVKSEWSRTSNEWKYAIQSPIAGVASKYNVPEKAFGNKRETLERSEPKYKIGERFKSNGNGVVFKIRNRYHFAKDAITTYDLETKDCETQATWHRSGVTESDLETRYTKVETQYTKVELEPKPKYKVGDGFKSRTGEVWTIIWAEVRNPSNPSKRDIDYQIAHNNIINFTSEACLEANYVQVSLPEEERREYDHTWDQMYEKLQDKQIAEGYRGTSKINNIRITKKDKQLVSLDGRPFIPDREAVLANWKLYEFPKEALKYKVGDKFKRNSSWEVPDSSNFQIVDYNVGLDCGKPSWCYALVNQEDLILDEEDLSPKEELNRNISKKQPVLWLLEYRLDSWTKGISITKKPRAKFKKGDIVVQANISHCLSHNGFEIKTVCWDSFINMWCYTIVDTGENKLSYLECHLALQPEKPPVEKKPFKNPLSDRPVSQGIRRGFSRD